MEDPLTEVTSKEQSIDTAGAQRGQEPQLGHPDILRLVDDREIKRRLIGGNVRRDPTEQIGPRNGLAFGEASPHALENRPQNLTLFTADAGLATKPRDIPVIFPVGNCQASTTSRHSPIRNRGEKRCFRTSVDTWRNSELISADGAMFG